MSANSGRVPVSIAIVLTAITCGRHQASLWTAALPGPWDFRFIQKGNLNKGEKQNEVNEEDKYGFVTTAGMIWGVKYRNGKYSFLERNDIRHVDRMTVDINTS